MLEPPTPPAAEIDAPPKSSDGGTEADDLARLGYAQELLREMGGFQNFALSFSIISILTGAVALYGHGLKYGGPRVMTLGWPLVALATMTVALSLAELASAFPTAGALYHWSLRWGGAGFGWATAWLNTIGQFAITAGIDYGFAELLCPTMGWGDARSTVLKVYVLTLVSHGILNHVGVRWVGKLQTLSAWWHLIGVALIVGALTVLAPKQPVSFLLTKNAAPETYGPYALVFAIGLLQAQWTFTGYDASAHVTEETRDPRKNAPWGIVMSVAISAVVGWLLVLAVTLAIKSLPTAASESSPFLYVLSEALGPRLGRALVFVALGAMWFCGLGSVTSCSRMLWAFARDGGIPASAWVAKVSHRFASPHVAIWVTVVASLAVAIWARAYAAITALSTIALYGSYVLPIWAAYRARKQGRFGELGPFRLGRWWAPLNVLAVVWVCVVSVLFVLPPNALAGYTFGGACVLLALAWFLGVRKRFAGPEAVTRLPTADGTS